MFSSDVDGDIRQPPSTSGVRTSDRDRDRDVSYVRREQHVQERKREREREREQRYRNRDKLAEASAATSTKHQHQLSPPHQQHQPTPKKSRPSPIPSSQPMPSHSHSHSYSQSESPSSSHSSDDGSKSRSSSSWFTSRVRGGGGGAGAGSGSGRGGRSVYGHVSVGSKSSRDSNSCSSFGFDVIHSIMNVRFLFPFLLGFILGVLVMCAFILIDPALHQRLHHAEQSHNNIDTPETSMSNIDINQDTTSRLKSMITKAADSVQCPVCPICNCPAAASAGAVGLGLSVPGGVIRACPACPPPVCSTASAGVLNRKRGMPRWSRWMRDTFLGHMVNFTDEWRKKPDQIMHQLNYLINADANYDNVQKLRFLDPFLDGVTDPALASAKWLTVADGYFGMEGAYVHRRARDLRRSYLSVNPSAKVPNIHVTGTALSNMTLRYALKYEYVDAISEENVEDLSFDDESFDYVLIKEAFHHLTRPYMGLYELIRVARHGVILVEPAEIPGRPPSYWASNPPYARSLVIPDVVIGFESDLIQFRLSVHELQKVAMALNLPAVAVKGLNNPMGSRHNRTLYFKDLENLNQLGLEGKRAFNLVAAVVFKQQPSKTLQDAMIKDHFLFLDVPYTPFPYDDYSVSYN